MQSAATNYPWFQELEKTVVNSLLTTFSLDFLLFQDKKGGDVDTIHNVRQKIYATDAEQKNYTQRGDYSKASSEYHSHENYIETGRRDKKLQQAGQLHDTYRSQTMATHEQRNLDHIISAKEIHDDPGRVLAGLDGVNLANKDSNLQTTLETINKSKKEKPISNYLDRLPNLIFEHEEKIKKELERLNSLPLETPEQKNKAQALEAKIRKGQKKVEALKSIDSKAMQAKDQKARAIYESEIHSKYYSSSKFMLQTGNAAVSSGLKMGTRQMLGLIMAEIWFELRTEVPRIIQDLQKNFTIKIFITHIKDTLQSIWQRIQARFQDFLISFKEGFFGGVMSSVTTTIFNIFATTQKLTIKIIREIWGQLVKAFK